MSDESRALGWGWVVLGMVALLALPRSGLGQELLAAAREGAVTRVEALLDERPDLVHEVDEARRTGLHLAAGRGHRDVVRVLLERGADPNAQDYRDETPLHRAALADRLEVAELLLDQGADPDLAGPQRRTALLFVARETGNVEMAALLLRAGADIEAQDAGADTPLELAAWRGFRPLVNFLLDSGAHVPVTGYEGTSLTQHAADNGLVQLFRSLADRGADLTIRNEDGGSLLHSASRGGSLELVRELLGRGLDVNAQDRYGRTPLHYAAERGRQPVAEALLAAGAGIDARSLAGHSPWNTAGDYGNAEMRALLREHGAQGTSPSFPELSGPYLGQGTPGPEPRLFAPDIVSSHRFEHGTVTFSPDGREAFWSTSMEPDESGYSFARLMTSTMENGRWSVPTPPAFGSPDLRAGDDVPFFSPDGERLYFLSRRPHPDLEGPAERIWYVERDGDGWSEPSVIVGGPNSLGHHWQFSVSAQGAIYFASPDPGGAGGDDLYVSRLEGGVYAAPENLGEQVNTGFGETSPFIAPDESYLIFMRSGDPGGHGGVDLYISFRDDRGGWTRAVNMGDQVNSPSHEICPMVTQDGRYFFFNSFRNGNADNYWMTSDVIRALEASVRREEG